jgi:hypothetical protein
MLLDIEFDFVSHELVCRTSSREIRKIPLLPVSTAQLFEEFSKRSPFSACEPGSTRCPWESQIPFGAISVRSIAATTVMPTRFWHTLRIADTLLKRFSTSFYGKISPVHFFWGSFDLAVTRFNGKRAPARPGVDEEYDEFLAQLMEDEKPVGLAEIHLVRKMAQHTWLANRALDGPGDKPTRRRNPFDEITWLQKPTCKPTSARDSRQSQSSRLARSIFQFINHA